MAKQIKYKNKDTSASTIYCDVSAVDKAWVMKQCKETLVTADLLKKHGNDDFNKPDVLLPKMGDGKRNSIASACEGVLDNMTNGTQRNFSNKTRDLLEKTFHQASKIDPSIEEVEFVEYESPTTGGTTMADLFDIESVTVVYKRK